MGSEMQDRHKEKLMLVQMLRAETLEDFKKVRNNLISSMEPEDVKVVMATLQEESEENRA